VIRDGSCDSCVPRWRCDAAWRSSCFVYCSYNGGRGAYVHCRGSSRIGFSVPCDSVFVCISAIWLPSKFVVLEDSFSSVMLIGLWFISSLGMYSWRYQLLRVAAGTGLCTGWCCRSDFGGRSYAARSRYVASSYKRVRKLLFLYQ